MFQLKKRFCSVFLSIVLCCAACSSGKGPHYAAPEFARERFAKFEPLTGELLFRNILDIWEYKSNLVVLGFENGCFLHVFDKRSGEKILETISLGRGPKEIGSLLNARLDRQGVLALIDGQQQKKLSFQLDSLLAHSFAAISEQPCGDLIWCRAVIPLRDRQLVFRNIGDAAEDTTGVVRFELRDTAGKAIDRSNGFPIADAAMRFLVYNEARVSVSPDERKLAVGTVWGAILETFSLEHGIEPLATRYYVEPNFNVGAAPGINEKTISGFADVYADDDRIYASYDGIRKVLEYSKIPAEERPQQFNRIVVFDWEGNGIEQIVTDYNVRALCAGEDGTIYAAVFDNLNRFYLAKIGPAGR